MSNRFISESDIAERRRVQKEIWDQNRKDGDPEEPPEEPVPDHRSLYDRLQEQKLKKQEDWEEAHKLKNMVRGLEDDEVDFLDFVDDKKLQEEKRIKAEENSALKEYRKKVSEMQQKAIESESLAELRTDVKKNHSSQEKKSQLSLIAKTIKRKSQEEIESSSKKHKSDITSEPNVNSSNCDNRPIKEKESLKCVAILPGLGVYTDSSDSENSESDSEFGRPCKVYVPRDITGRVVKLHTSGTKE